MGIHQLILALVLLLGLGQVAFAYPIFDPDHEAVKQGLKHVHNSRQGATPNPFLNLEAICDKNCIAVDNACAAKWGEGDGNCIQNRNSCIKACATKYGKRDLDTRNALSSAEHILNSRQGAAPSAFLNLQAICDKNCIAIDNACAAKWGEGDGNCIQNRNSCIKACAAKYPTKRDLEGRTVFPVEIEERAVELEERGVLPGPTARCVAGCREKLDQCSNGSKKVSVSCQSHFDNCRISCEWSTELLRGDVQVEKRDVEHVQVSERNCIGAKGICNKNCEAVRNRCAFGEGMLQGNRPKCENDFSACSKGCNRIKNICLEDTIAHPHVRRAAEALSEPDIFSRAAARPEETPCEKDDMGNCKNHAKVCVGGRCLAHMSHTD